MKKHNIKKPDVCVFASSKFARLFPNFKELFRGNINDDWVIFDCLSADNMGNYLNIVAVVQELPDALRPANIWVPTEYVLAVLLRSEDKKQMGFGRSSQDDKDQNQAGQSP